MRSESDRLAAWMAERERPRALSDVCTAARALADTGRGSGWQLRLRPRKWDGVRACAGRLKVSTGKWKAETSVGELQSGEQERRAAPASGASPASARAESQGRGGRACDACMHVCMYLRRLAAPLLRTLCGTAAPAFTFTRRRFSCADATREAHVRKRAWRAASARAYHLTGNEMAGD